MSPSPAEPSWEEYLSATARYLSEMRAAAESGTAPPLAPRRPAGTCPAAFRDQAYLLRLGFDQLIVEVSEHLSDLNARLATPARSPFRTRRQARYLDTPL